MSETKQFYYKNNRFQQLRGFYFTAQLGSLTKAANLMHLTQPSISLQIKALEDDLECKLFNRKGPYITITEEGVGLMKLVKPLVEGIDSLKENFHTTMHHTNEQQINVGANQATMLYLLPKLVHAYSMAHPDKKMKIHSASAMEGIEKLRQNKIDLIIGPPNFIIPEDCSYRALFYYDPVLITPKGHSLAHKENITIEEISKHHLILPPKHLHTIKGLEEALLQHDFQQSSVKLEFDGWEIIKKYVELDMAITIALSIAIEDDPMLVGTKLNHYFPRSSYGIITKKGKILPQKVQDFIKVIEASKSDQITSEVF